MNKDKIYIIGSNDQADRVRSAAKYYISTGNYDVRCAPGFESEELARHIRNISWADEIYIVPNPDDTIASTIVLSKLIAYILGKKIEQHYAEPRIKTWVRHRNRNMPVGIAVKKG